MDAAADEQVFNEVSDAVQAVLMRYVDQRHARTGEAREALCVVAGKALVVMGCMFAGNGLGLHDPSIGLRPAYECLDKLTDAARKYHGR